MSELTQESLEEALMQIAKQVESMEERITMRPSHLIVPPAIYNRLMYRSPAKKARGVRGRKRALYWRGTTLFWRMFK